MWWPDKGRVYNHYELLDEVVDVLNGCQVCLYVCKRPKQRVLVVSNQKSFIIDALYVKAPYIRLLQNSQS